MKRIVLSVLLLAIAGVGGYFLYWVAKSPQTAPPANIKVELTPERVERGRYVVALSDCFGCHAERDFSRFNGPIVPGGLGVGGPLPLEGLPGDVVVPNITPDPDTGLGAWTDGEIIRAVREGIGRDGRTLFAFMPYPGYRYMSDEDAQAVVAYLRSLPPVKKRQAPTRINFPVNLFMKEAPQPAGSVPPPNRSDPLTYGKYLVTLGGCIDCHTQEEKGKLVAGREYAGGRLLAILGTPFRVYSANITPDNDTGIGVWTEERFLQKIRSYKPYVEGESPKVGPESFTLMPWLHLCLLTDEDLKAMYAYLRTLKPIYNSVEKYEGPGAASGN
jgi:mono/diheme cytochrome c family protein